jgi:branched-chain amino acid transport system substrate-binding protein
MTAASAAVAACGLSSAGTGNPLLAGPTGQPITIGISEPLGGSPASDPFIGDGQACKIGYELWAADVNSHGGLLGRPVRLKFLDNKGQPNIAVANYRTLISQDKVNLVLAPFSSLLTVAVAPEVDKLHYMLVAGSAGSPKVYALGQYSLFSTNLPVVKQMVPFAQWVARLPAGKRPLTAAYPMVQDPFADPPVLSAQGILQAAGVKTVYPPGQGYLDIKPKALAADAKAVASKGAQMVVLGSVDVPTVQAFIQQFIAQHYTPKIFIAAAGPDQGQDFINAIGGPGNALGIMVPNGWSGTFANALSHVMVQEYIAKYGGTADAINADVAESYSAAEVLGAAVKATQSLSQQQLIGWLHGPGRTVQTVLGPVAFSKDGENTQAIRFAAIFQWQAGAGGTGARFVQVLGPGSAQQPLAVKPAWSG